MELKLQLYKQSVESFSYLANVDYESLQQVLDPRLIDGLENGMIQKFEIVTELSWKLAKVFLLKAEAIDAKTPKQSIKSFFAAGYLDEQNYLLWMQALDDRNGLSHRYDEEAYQAALNRMKSYVKLYLKLLVFFEGSKSS